MKKLLAMLICMSMVFGMTVVSFADDLVDTTVEETVEEVTEVPVEEIEESVDTEATESVEEETVTEIPDETTEDIPVIETGIDAEVVTTGDRYATVTLDGEVVECPVPARIKNERTCIPLRAIFEAMGAEVYWKDSNWSITSTLGDTTVFMQIGKNTMYVNGEAIELEVAPFLTRQKTFIPLRAVCEAFGYYVGWIDSTSTAVVSSTPIETEQLVEESESTETVEPTFEPETTPAETVESETVESLEVTEEPAEDNESIDEADTVDETEVTDDVADVESETTDEVVEEPIEETESEVFEETEVSVESEVVE